MNITNPGALKDPKDRRDYKAEIAMGAVPLPKEFSLADRIIKIKAQGKSGSCVGQSFAYYAEVLNTFETAKQTQLSARDVYSLIFIPIGIGGAFLRDGANKIVKTGVVLEKDATSYLNGKPPTEAFMRQRNDITEAEVERGYTYLAKSYVRLPEKSFETVKQAIFQNKGCIIGCRGSNEGWKQAIVKPGEQKWGHAVFGVGWKVINGKEYIQFVNSWGGNWGEKGFGYMGEDYFKSGQVFNPWTLMDISNEHYADLKRKATILAKMIETIKKIIGLLKIKRSLNN